MYYQKHQSGKLSDAPTQKFIGFHNPEYKKKVYSLFRDSFVFAQLVGVQEEEYRGAGRNCLYSLTILLLMFGLLLPNSKALLPK